MAEVMTEAMTDTHTILGLETSCDETAVAIVRRAASGKGEVLANLVLSQIDMHAPYGGVVPELAARAHIDHLDRLVAEALAAAEMQLGDMDAIAATAGPGLIGGVLVGLTLGKALALGAGLPFIGINHLEGHALTIRLVAPMPFPYLLLLVSGGHCQLLEVTGLGQYTEYGATRDDAVGEAFDKAAKLMGLGYPGGPEIEKQAQQGNPQAFALPRPLTREADISYDFSFSGLKTALRHQAEQCQPLTDSHIADLSASFQAAVLDCLADRTCHAMQRFADTHNKESVGGYRFVVAGGVAANQVLRGRLQEEAKAAGFSLAVAPPALCTDNAAMIAWAGAERLAGADMPNFGQGVAAKARWPLTEIGA